ncbi:MAG: hypothetical protein M3535_01395 [Actinomycetota bacterium]|nr:hypothetical protein [Actinomycetota bacterium]
MSGLIFLVAALAVSLIGSVVLWLYHRQPTSIYQGIDDFSREMRALAPEEEGSATSSVRRRPPRRR